jgi:hypothetical protein
MELLGATSMEKPTGGVANLGFVARLWHCHRIGLLVFGTNDVAGIMPPPICNTGIL